MGAYLRQLSKAIEALGEVKPHDLVSTIGLEHINFRPPERLVKVYRPHTPAQTGSIALKVTQEEASALLALEGRSGYPTEDLSLTVIVNPLLIDDGRNSRSPSYRIFDQHSGVKRTGKA